ncbi:hypothetical protein CDV31_000621 [Fusarium ambrosium]|uniref:Uncharacterized protein n=1 Tax=Fusarium ambrosium TaxID=131363 RepID=A0A428V1P1_9HYPO|nr:hypothetical protein CDV31_000621 [Fusarium ambrosium]
MPPAALGYIQSQPYRLYLNGGTRPDFMLPPLIANQNGGHWIVPGEVYCRHVDRHGHLCNKSHPFASTYSLRNHYRKVHLIEVPFCNSGTLTGTQDNEVTAWFHEVVNLAMPTWNPLQPDNRPTRLQSTSTPTLEPSSRPTSYLPPTPNLQPVQPPAASRNPPPAPIQPPTASRNPSPAPIQPTHPQRPPPAASCQPKRPHPLPGPRTIGVTHGRPQ